MGRTEVKSLIKKLCRKNGCSTLSSMISKARNVDDGEASVYKPKGDWNETWKDKVHHEGLDDKKAYIDQLSNNIDDDWAKDDVTGMPLDPALVREARRVEMTFFKNMKVYTIVVEDHQKSTGGKIIDVRWIDVNKCDMENPDMRSRLVGKEFREEMIHYMPRRPPWKP